MSLRNEATPGLSSEQLELVNKIANLACLNAQNRVQKFLEGLEELPPEEVPSLVATGLLFILGQNDGCLAKEYQAQLEAEVKAVIGLPYLNVLERAQLEQAVLRSLLGG